MRLSALLRSGPYFGNLGKNYGVYRYAPAPGELKPFHGLLQHWGKTAMWYAQDWYFILPPILVGYATYSWAIEENYKANRKNPADYENDT